MAAQLSLPTVPRLGDRLATALPPLPETRLFRWDAGRPFSRLFPRGFEAFESHFGVDGLARIDEQGLEISVLVAGSSLSFRDFIAAAKQTFERIAVWNVTGPNQRDALLYADFTEAELIDSLTRERQIGLLWTREYQDACDAKRTRPAGARWRGSSAAERQAAEANTATVMERVRAMRGAA